jgi:hypothetical protein
VTSSGGFDTDAAPNADQGHEPRTRCDVSRTTTMAKLSRSKGSRLRETLAGPNTGTAVFRQPGFFLSTKYYERQKTVFGTVTKTRLARASKSKECRDFDHAAMQSGQGVASPLLKSMNWLRRPFLLRTPGIRELLVFHGSESSHSRPALLRGGLSRACQPKTAGRERVVTRV